MTFDLEKIYALLPALYRIRDIELDRGDGPPLKGFLSVVADQIAVIEDNLEQLYDDEFIETCAEWVIPYIGDLVGARGVFAFPGATFSLRGLVANTLADRRRKGTVSIIEQVARDVTGWPASVVEYFQLLATTQYMKHIRSGNLSFTGMRAGDALANIGTPFDSVARTAEMRRIEPRRGKHNIPNIGIFLWRLAPLGVTRAPAFRVDDRRYRFHPLGRDIPLFTEPVTEDRITHLAGPLNVPAPIRRHALGSNLDAYYGLEQSILITTSAGDVPLETGSPRRVQIQACNLSDVVENGVVTGWAHRPSDSIAIDPELGRIAFPEDFEPPQNVRVSYVHGFPAQIGGGEYSRSTTFIPGVEPMNSVTGTQPIQPALDAAAVSGGVVEIRTNEVYNVDLVLRAPDRAEIELRAADGFRPVLTPTTITVTGGETSQVTINGLLIDGFIRVPAMDSSGRPNRLEVLRLRHCTVVPAGATIVVESPDLLLLDIQQCVVGGLRMVDGGRVQIRDSVVDATGAGELAYAGVPDEEAGTPIQLVNTTVIGRVFTRVASLISNSILVAEPQPQGGPVSARAERLQEGCVRFSRVPEDARLPRRHRCTTLPPDFQSLVYGNPAYCQLGDRCPIEVLEGADDGSEMGVYHELFQPQRVANLRSRLDEYLRFGLEAGIFFAT
jgi:hypothetical protein